MKRWIILLAALMLLTLSGCEKEAAEPAPAMTNPATEYTAPAATETVPVPSLAFSTVDSDGNPVDESIFAGHSLIMVNLWEPWCGPCVREMPDLQRLYETYADQGLLILGVYSSEEGAAEVLKSTRISYPTILYTDAFSVFATPYVPTTVFLDEQGNLITGPYVGSADMGSWATIIEDLL